MSQIMTLINELELMAKKILKNRLYFYEEIKASHN